MEQSFGLCDHLTPAILGIAKIQEFINPEPHL